MTNQPRAEGKTAVKLETVTNGKKVVSEATKSYESSDFVNAVSFQVYEDDSLVFAHSEPRSLTFETTFRDAHKTLVRQAEEGEQPRS